MSNRPPEIRYYDAAAENRRAEAIRRFAEFRYHLFDLTPRIFVAPTLIGVNVLVLVVMGLFGVNVFSPSVADLINWGADFGPRTLTGEWWRLFTSMFLHVGVIHLGFNMWALYAAGPFVERMLGNTGFLLMYLIAGLCGGLASLAWNPMAVSAGASGAIFGIFGCLLGLVVRGRGSIPPELLTELRSSGMGFLFYNLVFGMMIPHIDMAAHLGGLAGGFACGLVLSQPFTPAARMGRFWRNLLLAGAGSAVLGLGAAGVLSLRSNFAQIQKELQAQKELQVQKELEVQKELQHFGEVESDTMERMRAALTRMEKRQISQMELADIIEREVLPPWSECRQRLAGVKIDAAPLQQAVMRRVEYMGLRQSGWTLLVQGLRENDAEAFKASQEKLATADAMARRISQGTDKNAGKK